MNLTRRQIDVLETLRDNKRAYVMREFDRKTQAVTGALVFTGPGGSVIRADRMKAETVNVLINACDKNGHLLLQTIKCGLGRPKIVNHFTLSPTGRQFLRDREQKRKER